MKVIKRPLNIIGSYRVCEENHCKTLVSCPYIRCKKHWISISTDTGNMKEMIATDGFI